MTDFAIKVTVRNAHLLRAMRVAGFNSASQLAKASGVSNTIVCELLTFKRSPLLKNGEWSSNAFALSSALRVEPEHLWPDAVRHLKAKRASFEADMTLDEVKALAAPEISKVDRVALDRLLAELPERQRCVLNQRYGLDGDAEMTGHELAAEMHRSAGRIYEIEAQALMKLKRKIQNRNLKLIELAR